MLSFNEKANLLCFSKLDYFSDKRNKHLGALVDVLLQYLVDQIIQVLALNHFLSH